MNIHMYLLWQTKLAADYHALSFVVEIEDFFILHSSIQELPEQALASEGLYGGQKYLKE